MRAKSIGLLAVVLVASSACGDPEGLCDAGELERALASASPGETVRLGDCSITASLVVPAGVTLTARSPRVSAIVAPDDRSAVELTPGDLPTTLRNVTVVANGRIGIVSRGSGSARLENVTVLTRRGVAVGAEGLDSLTLDGVSLAGPVTADNAADFARDLTYDDAPTHGLVILDVGAAELTSVDSVGFVRFGAVIGDTGSSWTGGNLNENLGVGLLIAGGSARLDNVDVGRTYRGQNLVPAYGAIFTAEADVRTTSLRAEEIEGIGVLHLDASARHTDPVVNDNQDVGFWTQRAAAFEISGDSASIVGNQAAGVVILESAHVDVRDATIADSQLSTRIVELSAIDVGDGIHLVDSTEDISLVDLTLTSNQRVGLLLDLGGGDLSDVTLDGIVVEGSGGQLGAVAQNGTIEPGWDSGVERSPALEANDTIFVGELDVVAPIASYDIPVPEDLLEGGLAVILE